MIHPLETAGAVMPQAEEVEEMLQVEQMVSMGQIRLVAEGVQCSVILISRICSSVVVVVLGGQVTIGDAMALLVEMAVD